MEKSKEAKTKYINVRVNDDEAQMVDTLASDYGIDKSQLVLFALQYVRKKRPAFTIEPKGKAFAPAVEIASAVAIN